MTTSGTGSVIAGSGMPLYPVSPGGRTPAEIRAEGKHFRQIDDAGLRVRRAVEDVVRRVSLDGDRSPELRRRKISDALAGAVTTLVLGASADVEAATSGETTPKLTDKAAEVRLVLSLQPGGLAKAYLEKPLQAIAAAGDDFDQRHIGAFFEQLELILGVVTDPAESKAGIGPYLARFQELTKGALYQGSSMLQRIYHHVWTSAYETDPSIEGENWGENHAFDDLARLLGAVQKVQTELTHATASAYLDHVLATMHDEGFSWEQAIRFLRNMGRALEVIKDPGQAKEATDVFLIRFNEATHDVKCHGSSIVDRVYHHVFAIAKAHDASIEGDNWGREHAFENLPRLHKALEKVQAELRQEQANAYFEGILTKMAAEGYSQEQAALFLQNMHSMLALIKYPMQVRAVILPFLARFEALTSNVMLDGVTIVARIYWHVWVIAIEHRLPTMGDNWGEANAFSDGQRLCAALKRVEAELPSFAATT